MTGLLIVAAVCLIYSRSLRGEFLTDDYAIHDMEGLHQRFSSEMYRCGGSHWRCYRDPRALTHLGYYWTWRVFGFNPMGWHGVNIMLHLICIGLVARILTLLGMAPGSVLLATAVFALHPLQVPAVSWISGRAGIQCAMFAYAAIVLLLTGFWLLALVSQFFAQRSKEEAWVYLLAWPMLAVFSSTI